MLPERESWACKLMCYSCAGEAENKRQLRQTEILLDGKEHYI